MIREKAIVLVSGGLDSATTLGIARSEGYACYAMSFDYGQRHKVELESAALGFLGFHRLYQMFVSFMRCLDCPPQRKS